ncbi:MAG: histidine kinase [Saprospiraceae bacterium]
MEKLFWHNDTIYAISDNSNIYQLTPQGQLQLVFQHPYQAHFNDLLIRSNGDIILGSSGPPNRNIFINGINHQGIRAKDYPPLQAMLKTPIMTTSDVTFSNIRQLNWNEKQHDFFYSTNRGLFWYDSQDTKLEQIGVARYDWRIYPDTFSHRTYLTRQDSIYSFYDDKLQVERTLPVLVTALWAKDERYLWLGTQNNGLWEWDRRVDSMQQISTRKYINAIYQDGERHLLATQEGVAVLEAINGTYKETYCYNRKDGLLTAEVLDVLADSQFIYAATIQGIMKIEKNAAPFRIDDTLQRLKIRAIHVNDSIRSHSDIEQLKHKENQFLIQYHLLDFPSKGNIQYQYQLQPIQDKWTTTDAKEVRFTKLPPNDYTFLLKATDWYGNEYKLKTPLTFCIQKAYWQTWWFRGLLLSLFLGATAIAIKWREQQQMKKIAHEKSLNQRIAELQLQSLRAQMNPHFIFNALGSIQYFIQTHRTDEADNYLTMFARLMRKYLDSATERMIDLATEIAMLEEYTQLEMMRFEGMFTTHIHLAENIDAESEIIPAMLLQPFVENAINHGLQPRKAEGGQLIIKFTKDAVGILVCTISDNGIGRENAAQHHKKNHTSRGMKNIYSRIETLRANKLGNIELKIQDLDEQQQAYPGTQVKITFNQTHYDDL